MNSVGQMHFVLVAVRPVLWELCSASGLPLWEQGLQVLVINW